MNVIYNWTEPNNMKMNIGKCKEMIFDFARVKQEFLPLTIKDVVVEREKSARILGLIVKDNLKWNKTPAQAFTPPADEKKMGTISIFVYYAVYGSGRGRCRNFLVLKWGGGS